MVGYGRAKYVTGTRLGTSSGQGWKRLLAERWSHTQGDLGEVEPRETEVIVLLKGCLRVRRRGDGQLQCHDAVPGTVWLCPAGVAEDMIHLSGEVEESLHLYLPAKPLATVALQELDVDADSIRLRYDGGFRDPLVEQIARAVHAEMVESTPAGSLLVESLAAALGVHLLRRYSNLEAKSLPQPAARGALDARRLERVTEFIEAHLGKDLPIDALAKQACLSPFHFARAFKSATGVAPHRYVIERRISRAQALLEHGRLPIATIADHCGFSSQAHLARWFGRIVGMTPGRYRGR